MAACPAQVWRRVQKAAQIGAPKRPQPARDATGSNLSGGAAASTVTSGGRKRHRSSADVVVQHLGRAQRMHALRRSSATPWRSSVISDQAVVSVDVLTDEEATVRLSGATMVARHSTARRSCSIPDGGSDLVKLARAEAELCNTLAVSVISDQAVVSVDVLTDEEATVRLSGATMVARHSTARRSCSIPDGGSDLVKLARAEAELCNTLAVSVISDQAVVSVDVLTDLVKLARAEAELCNTLAVSVISDQAVVSVDVLTELVKLARAEAELCNTLAVSVISDQAVVSVDVLTDLVKLARAEAELCNTLAVSVISDQAVVSVDVLTDEEATVRLSGATMVARHSTARRSCSIPDGGSDLVKLARAEAELCNTLAVSVISDQAVVSVDVLTDEEATVRLSGATMVARHSTARRSCSIPDGGSGGRLPASGHVASIGAVHEETEASSSSVAVPPPNGLISSGLEGIFEDLAASVIKVDHGDVSLASRMPGNKVDSMAEEAEVVFSTTVQPRRLFHMQGEEDGPSGVQAGKEPVGPPLLGTQVGEAQPAVDQPVLPSEVTGPVTYAISLNDPVFVSLIMSLGSEHAPKALIVDDATPPSPFARSAASPLPDFDQLRSPLLLNPGDSLPLPGTSPAASAGLDINNGQAAPEQPATENENNHVNDSAQALEVDGARLPPESRPLDNPRTPSDFIKRISKPVRAQLSLPVVQRHSKKVTMLTSTPRRSRRVAKLPPEPVQQAMATVCRQIGVMQQQERISDAALHRYAKVFEEPLSRELAALAALFGWQMRCLWFAKTQADRPWNGLELPARANVKAMFKISIISNVGNGQNTLFWTDRWVHVCSVSDLAPLVFAQVPARTAHSRTVAQALTDQRWEQDIVGALSAEAFYEYYQLWSVLLEFHLDLEEDQHHWIHESSRIYSSKTRFLIGMKEALQIGGAERRKELEKARRRESTMPSSWALGLSGWSEIEGL
ncbi:hypothetical protein PR202_ga10737 [Eleusine coracana subsp. coracana]|uniref:Uncharacterized protein n=1 Tax=Eleusine coracana subsp. coracana TaxID=191504 RepID=A0AAV5C7N0_ELECO|nr:hypothetical protein PR202_ga10737 [Eleusine coracana subsp. coracana]